ncbi:MAG: serine/threonine protein kinase, partial [SAR324 cluster bacterium]|nr:serine/threonine protein kinase [SAR324 cluster bacterium]
MADISSTHIDGKLLARRYRLEELLGVGAMGSVYKAYDELLKEFVALKILLPTLSADELSIKRFIKEASLTRKINHSNVIRTYDVGMDQSKLFISMELVSGSSLKDLVAKGPLDVNENIAILSETCRGLHAIHEAGIVHRDLKPSNIILADNGFIKIADFGIAHTPFSSDTSGSELVGTAAYMAPEQWRQTELGPQTDLYSLGIIAYEMCTGIYPFKAETPMEYMYQHLHVSVIPPFEINFDIPSWLNVLILQLLSKDPKDRPNSALDVIIQLEKGLTCTNAHSDSCFEAYEVVDDPFEADKGALDLCPSSCDCNPGQSIKSPIHASTEPLIKDESTLKTKESDVAFVEEELENFVKLEPLLSPAFASLICAIIGGILFYLIAANSFFSGPAQGTL